jgi:hypothetical protein
MLDLLGRSAGELRKVILTALKAIHFQNPDRVETAFEKIKVMLSPQIKLLPQQLNCQHSNFQFAFACCGLRDHIDTDKINPSNWYLMPDD